MLKNLIEEMDNDLKICKTSYFRERKSMNKEYIKKYFGLITLCTQRKTKSFTEICCVALFQTSNKRNAI